MWGIHNLQLEPVSWACRLHSCTGPQAHKGKTLHLTFPCCHLEIQIAFEQGILHFYLTPDPANYKVSLAYCVILGHIMLNAKPYICPSQPLGFIGKPSFISLSLKGAMTQHPSQFLRLPLLPSTTRRFSPALQYGDGNSC